MDHAPQESSLPPLERDGIDGLVHSISVELRSDEDHDELGSAQRVPDHIAEGLAGHDGTDVDEDLVTR